MKPKVKQKPGKVTDRNKVPAKNPPYLLWLGIIVVVTAFVFSPMLKNEFTSWDDKDYIVSNPTVRSLKAENLKTIFTEPIANNYHPFTILSLAMNYSANKLNPQSYYLWNLLLHLANICLVFFFVKKLSKNNVHVALFSALLFALHPMHVESVAWVSERKDVLYLFFFVAGLITYLKYLEERKVIYFLATFLLGLCSMFSKPAAIIFPLVLVAIDLYKTSRLDFKFQLKKIPFFLMAAFFMYMTWIAQKTNDANVADFQTFNILERFVLACFGLVIYVVKLVFPVHLAAFHPYPEKLTLLYYLMPLVVASACYCIYRYKKHRQLLTFGFLFYGINLVLVLQFVSIGAALYAERYSYMPYTGLFFAVGMMLFDNQKSVRKQWIVTLAIAAVFTFLTLERVKVWHNSETLWTDQIEKYPDSPRGYYDRGIYYAGLGQYDKALADYNISIKNKREYKNLSNRAAAYISLQDYDKAFADYREAYALDSSKIEVLVGLSQIYISRQQFEPALEFVDRSLRIKSSYEGQFTRAVVLKALRRYDEAALAYQEALRLNDNVSAHFNLGNIYLVNLKDFQKAASEYEAVAAQNPAYPHIQTYKGMALFGAGRFAEAIATLSTALASDPKDAQAYAYRAQAYHKSGENQQAQSDADAARKLGFEFDATAFQ